MKVLKYLVIFLLWSSLAFGANQTIGPTGDYPATAAGFQDCAAGRADGEYCYVQDGTYNDLGTITIDDARAAATYIKAQNPGQVTFSGTSKFVLSGNYWVLDGFVFDGFTGSNYDRVVHISGDYNKVTNSEFRNFGGVGFKAQGVRVADTGDYAEISYNYFHDLSAQAVIAYASASDVALEPHIHHNYFKDNTYADAFDDDTANVFLAGVWGVSDDQDMTATIEYNVFENFDGDSECLCIKNSSNTIRYNVFLNIGSTNAVEAISLRLGEDNTVFNNWFFRTDTSNMAGINVSDKGHKIVNNYFHGLGGALRGVYFLCGNLTNRDKAENVLFESNTFYNCTNSRLLQFGENSTLPPTNITIRNNILSSGRIGYDYTSGTCTATYTGNVAYTTGSYFSGTGCGGSWPAADSTNMFQLSEAEFNELFTDRSTSLGNIYVLTSSNEAINNSTRNDTYTTDIDGQTRSATCDTGCDEYDISTEFTKWPISTSEVGPTWYAGYKNDPNISGSGPSGTVGCTSSPRTVSHYLTTELFSVCRIGAADGGSFTGMSSDTIPSGGYSHAVDEAGLACGQTITRYVYCQDINGNEDNVTISYYIQDEASPSNPSPTAIGVGISGTFSIQ